MYGWKWLQCRAEGVIREASVPGCVTWREFQCRAEGVVGDCSGYCGQVWGRPFSAGLRVIIGGPQYRAVSICVGSAC